MRSIGSLIRTLALTVATCTSALAGASGEEGVAQVTATVAMGKP